MSFGKTAKLLRRSQHISQSTLCTNSISRTSISKIENEKQHPSVDMAFFIMDKLDISPDEFKYIDNNWSLSPKSRIATTFITATETHNMKLFENIYQNSAKFLNTQYDQNINFIFAIINMKLNIFKYSKTEKSIKALTIWKYISKKDFWTKLDLYLINRIVDYLNDDQQKIILDSSIYILNKKYAHLKKLALLLHMKQAKLLLRQSQSKAAQKELQLCLKLCRMLSCYNYLLVNRIRLSILNKQYTKAFADVNTLDLIDNSKLAKHMNLEILSHLQHHA